MNWRGFSRFTIMMLVVVGAWQLGQGIYIHAKANLAQYLIRSSWQTTLLSQQNSKPWPWADTWPVSRMIMPSHDVDMFVLAGDNGRTLAFGPGYRFGTALPGNIGNSIIAAHRDTHFRFLKDVAIGEVFSLQNSQGNTAEYKIVDIHISHFQNARLPLHPDRSLVTLVTCYPFDSISVGGPLRYVVIAEKITSSLSI